MHLFAVASLTKKSAGSSNMSSMFSDPDVSGDILIVCDQIACEGPCSAQGTSVAEISTLFLTNRPQLA